MNKLAVLSLTLASSLSAQVTFDRLLNANKEPQNWLTYSGTMMSQRYSLLTQITRDNAKNLDQAWTFKTQTREKFESTPLVVDGVMYTVVPPPPAPPRGGGGRGGGAGRGGRGPAPAAAGEAGLVPAAPAAPAPPATPESLAAPAPPPPSPVFDIVALNAVTGEVKWTYSYLPSTDAKPCCGPRESKYLAILGNTLYMGTTDAHLIAIDAKTGKLQWDTQVAVAKQGYAITHAPLIVKDKVIIGTLSRRGEYGIRRLRRGRPTTPPPAKRSGDSTTSPSPANPETTPGRAIPGNTAERPSGPPAPTIPSSTSPTGAPATPVRILMATLARETICIATRSSRWTPTPAGSNGITSSRRTMSAIGTRRRSRCSPISPGPARTEKLSRARS